MKCEKCGVEKKSKFGLHCPSCAMKIKWTSPEYRTTRRSTRGRKKNFTPEQRQMYGHMFYNPESIEKRRKKMDAIYQSQEYKDLQRASQYVHWSSPGAKENHSRLQRQYISEHPEHKAKLVENLDWQRRTAPRYTSIERKVLEFLKSTGERIEPQARFDEIGGYVDFYLPDRKLVIECDGDYWHSLLGERTKDRRRDEALAKLDIRVLRLREWQINHQFEICAGLIIDALYTGNS